MTLCCNTVGIKLSTSGALSHYLPNFVSFTGVELAWLVINYVLFEKKLTMCSVNFKINYVISNYPSSVNGIRICCINKKETCVKSTTIKPLPLKRKKKIHSAFAC